MSQRTWEIGPISSPHLQWGTVANNHGATHSCKVCGVILLTGERPGFCCGPKGNRFALIPPLPPLPPEYDTIVNDPNISRLSRRLNLIFSFAALESSHSFPTPGNPSFVAISGRIYHRLRSSPEANSAVRWLLYDGFDPSAAPHGDTSIPPEWIILLRECFLRVNPLTRSIYFLHDLQIRDPEDFSDASVIIRDVGTSEIAAIMCYDNTVLSDVSPRRLVVSRRNNRDQYIPTVSRLWEPLAYPLFFPSGTLGWGLIGSIGDSTQGYNDGNFDAPTTQIWLYRARLLREPRFHVFGRLTNEYVVDMFTRELECRLRYIRSNQSRLRFLEHDAALMAEDTVEESENIYLPASFLGSQRWASNQIADSLAIAADYGPPTFFLTFTCNSDWPEIQSQLLPGQTFTDVPAVVCRVFKQKLAKLMSSLRTMFPNAGRLVYSITSIEFQKRGLPHAHILLKCAQDCLRPEHIDQVISATLPTNSTDAMLVLKFMVHPSHPPGVINHIPPDSDHPLKYCERWKDNARICRFGYPKPITPETTFTESGRVRYLRRHKHDENIVPHCLPLLRKFQCHMNMEIGGSGQLFQYLFKYIHKGKTVLSTLNVANYQNEYQAQIVHISEFHPGQRANRSMKLKNTGTVAITLLLKAPGVSWDSALRRKHHPLHHSLFISPIQSITDDIQPANQLGHFPLSNDIFYVLMAHLSWMGPLAIFLTFATPSTSNSSASSRTV